MRLRYWLPLSCLATLSVAGCPSAADLQSLISAAADAVNGTIDNLQDTDIRVADAPLGADGRGLDVLLPPGVEVVTNPTNDLRDVDVKTATLIAFDNVTETDMFIKFRVNGVEQSALVFAGKSVVLRYRCPDRIRLLAEFDFDAKSGEFAEAWDLSGIGLVNEGAVIMQPSPRGDMPPLNEQGAQSDPNFPDAGDPNDFDDPTFDGDPNDFGDPNGLDFDMDGDPNFFGFEDDETDQLDPDAFDGEGLLPGERFDGVKELAARDRSFVCGELIVFEIDDTQVRLADRVPLEEVKQ